jgi:hypothetical protein
MPKLSPEAQAKRTAKFKATRAMKKNRPQSVAEREAQERDGSTYDMVEASVAEVLAARPIKAIHKASDARVELARAIVHLLTKVLQ